MIYSWALFTAYKNSQLNTRDTAINCQLHEHKSSQYEIWLFCLSFGILKNGFYIFFLLFQPDNEKQERLHLSFKKEKKIGTGK